MMHNPTDERHSVFFRKLLLVLALGVGSMCCAQERFAPVVHGISVLTGTESRFVDASRGSDPDLPLLMQEPRARYVLARIENRSGRRVKAYVVEWKFGFANGMSRTLYQTVVSMGEGPSQLYGRGYMLQPGESEIISPFRMSRSRSGQRLKRAPNSAQTPFRGFDQDLGVVMSGVVSSSVSIDSVLYEDGVVAGPDLWRFRERYVILRHAEAAVGRAALAAESPGEIFEALQKFEVAPGGEAGSPTARMEMLEESRLAKLMQASLRTDATGKLAQRIARSVVTQDSGQLSAANLDDESR